MLEHDLEYQSHARYECHGCKGVTSHKRVNIKQMENRNGGESSVFVMECRLCDKQSWFLPRSLITESLVV